MTQGRTAFSIAVAATAMGTLALHGCGRVSEIILVVDTDFSIPSELDTVQISVTGPSGPTASIPVIDLVQDPAPFPRSLGLVDDGNASAVQIKVDGLHEKTTLVASEQVQTSFIPGQKKMLRIVLSATCRGITCADTETCSLGKCVALDRKADSLPDWSGVLPTPVADDPPLRIEGRTLWAGGWRTCATKGQNIFCWGDNDHGQISNNPIARIPQRVPMATIPKPISSIALGYKHTCVCDTDHQVWCFGQNNDGQLGTAAPGDSSTPTRVPDIDDCSQVAAGGAHTCIIRNGPTTSGSVWCWGSNDRGQLGQPGFPSSTPTPQRVSDFVSAIEIAAGDKFTCARLPNAVYCWGDNMMAQLATDPATTMARSAPGRVTVPSVSELVLGRYFACVMFSTKTVSCWGENTDTMTGIETPVVPSTGMHAPNPTPSMIPGLDNATDIGLGHQHACARRETGIVSCWGNGADNKLGDGQASGSVVPVDVVDLIGATELSVGLTHSCARNPGGITCWGQNILNQLGDGSGGMQTRPVRVVGF